MTPHAGKSSERGFVSLLVVMVMIGSIVVVGAALSEASISELQHGYFAERSEVAWEAVEACAEEAAMRLKRSGSYVGGTLAVGDASCTIDVGGTNPSRTFSATSTVDQFAPSVSGTMTVVGRNVTLTGWEPYAGF